MSDLTFPFNEKNTALVPLLNPVVARCVSLGFTQPWVVVPMDDLIHHCNVDPDDSKYKLHIMALRDQGVKFMVLSPADANIENILGDTVQITDRVDANHSDKLV
jgi:hypothetical protein